MGTSAHGPSNASISPRRRPTLRRIPLAASALALAGAALVGCSDSDGGSDGRIRVSASVHPMAHLVEEIGGDLVDVDLITRPGVEAHDLELRPRDVAAIAEADLVVYLSGFQPAVDDAVAEAGDRSFDVADAADLIPFEDHGHDHDDDGHGDDGHDDHDHAEEGHDHDHADDGHDDGHAEEGHDGHDHGHLDPHFWLDPQRMASVAEAVRDRLIEVSPEDADVFRANASDLLARLDSLDRSFEAGLAECDHREIVTNHAAFGYLTDRYGLEEHGITGFTPDEEPTSGQLATAAAYVRENDVETIFFETLVSPDVARTVADETGAEIAVLDPIEGITDASDGDDYEAVMSSNLAALRSGLGCG